MAAATKPAAPVSAESIEGKLLADCLACKGAGAAWVGVGAG